MRSILAALLFLSVQAQAIDTKLFSAMHWRLIGPFRAGRVTAVAGVPGDPTTFYFGTPGGGIWKTTDAGRVWQPIFDQIPEPSIGALVVAPSNTNILYAGTGEQTPGNGIYKSTDAGRSWAHVGLPDARFIQAIAVDPKNPDIAIVGANSLGFAILWRPLPKNAFAVERGIYKTTNGGKTWTKVMTRDDTIGVVDMCADPNNPRTLYAVLYKPASGSGKSAVAATSEIVKSTDQGSTWKSLATKGLPDKDRGRMGIIVAPGEHGHRLYTILDQGFYRSDDAGASWQQSTKDPRVVGSSYFSRVFTDPVNPNVVYVAQTSMYRSRDGGHTFEAWAGAPSGDDFHVLWIDPQAPSRMQLGVDQGAVISVDAGQTWTTWYNQPTGQFYHVTTDNLFPYRLYGAQQDSGTVAVPNRTDYGQIRPNDWFSIGGFEYCFIAPDPLNPNVVYSGGWYGTVVRFDKATGQVPTVFERGTKYRTAQMAPLMFSPHDPHTLYLGTQFVLKTTDGGQSWQAISPDLTGYVEKKDKPEKEPDPDEPPAPALSALALSSVHAGVMWAGTTNRIVQITRDAGTTWHNVSPPALTDPDQILTLEAGRHDAGTAFVAIGATRHSASPLILRTHNYGATWQKIVNGLPEHEKARVVREDPVRRGLLYAGTDTGVFVSLDDGDRWQPLQFNLPPAPVTDLDVHGHDLVASTFGRSLWILDDLTPLRASNADVLIPPATAVRTRWDNYQDTPLPADTPTGKNPPDGTIIDYFLQTPPSGEITMSIMDENGGIIRKFSSRENAANPPPANVPDYWFAPPEKLPARIGLNRFVWDLRYPTPLALPYGYYGSLMQYTEFTLADHAIPLDTPREQPQGPLVLPGKYTVELNVNGHPYRQQLTLTLDPRLKLTQNELRQQFDLEQRIVRGMAASYHAFKEIEVLPKDTAKKLDAVVKGTRDAPGFGPLNRDFARLMSSVERADAAPTQPVREAVEEKCKSLADAFSRWRELVEKEKLPPIKTDTAGCGR